MYKPAGLYIITFSRREVIFKCIMQSPSKQTTLESAAVSPTRITVSSHNICTAMAEHSELHFTSGDLEAGSDLRLSAAVCATTLCISERHVAWTSVTAVTLLSKAAVGDRTEVIHTYMQMSEPALTVSKGPESVTLICKCLNQTLQLLVKTRHIHVEVVKRHAAAVAPSSATSVAAGVAGVSLGLLELDLLVEQHFLALQVGHHLLCLLLAQLAIPVNVVLGEDHLDLHVTEVLTAGHIKTTDGSYLG